VAGEGKVFVLETADRAEQANGPAMAIAAERGFIVRATQVLAGDIRDPGLVTGSRAIRDLFGDEDRSVAVLITGVLDRFADAGQARRYVSAIMDWAPEGSFLAASLALTDGTDADAAATAGSVIMPWTLADITALFDGLTLLRPGVVEVSRWRVSGAARTGCDLAVLRRAAGVAQKDTVRSGPGAAACDARPTALAGPLVRAGDAGRRHGLMTACEPQRDR
jgi:S-adenosyl methyltransferase